MWVVGIVALSQITFLPGAVLFRYLRFAGLNAIERVTGIFISSLVANYLLASLLVVVHLQAAITWWVVISAEAIYLAFTWRSSSVRWTLDIGRMCAVSRKLSLEAAIAAILLFAGGGIMSYLLYVNWGTTYNSIDDVVSWDRWATEWSSGKLPSDSSLYPQLLPSNSSIGYVLLGTTDVKMFAKAVTPLYSVLPILLFLSLAIRRRDSSYLIGGALYAWILFQYLSLAFLMYGYADVPLACFGFVAFYSVYADPDGPNRYAIIAGLIASIGALLTKQGGVYVVAAMGIYAFYWRSRRVNEKVFRKDVPTVLLLVTAAFCTVWYAVKFVRIFQGYENPHMRVLIETLHQGRGYGQRIVATWHMFMTCRPYTGPVVTIAIALVVLGSLFVRRTRFITIYCVFPFLLLYSMFFSYEIRNASLAFPLVALVCGETLHELFSFAPRFNAAKRIENNLVIVAALSSCMAAWMLTGEKGRDLLPPGFIRFLTDPWIAEATSFYAYAVFAAALLCLVLSLAVRVDTGLVEIGRLAALAVAVFVLLGATTHRWEDIVFSQIQLIRARVGDAEVNAKLYETIREKHITAGIVTDYWFLRALPDIKQLFRQTYCYAPCTVEGLRASIARYPDAGFILMGNVNLAPETRQALDRGGEFTTLFQVNGFRMIQVNR